MNNSTLNIGITFWIIGAITFSNYAWASPEENLKKLKSLYSTGNIYLQNGQFKNALESFKRALRPARELGNEEDLAHIFDKIGSANFNLGRYAIAINHLNQALKLRRRLNKKEDIAPLLIKIGNTYLKNSEFDKAIESFQESLALSKAIGRNDLVGLNLNGIGIVSQVQGKLKEAYSFFMKALKVAREQKMEADIGRILANLATIDMSWGNFEKAIPNFKKFLEISKRQKNSQGTAEAYLKLGVAHRSKGENEKALFFIDKAQNIFEKTKNKGGLASIKYLKGGFEYESGMLIKAERNYKEAVNIYRELHLENSIEYANARNGLGLVYAAKGKFDEAIKSHQVAKNIFQKSGFKHLTALAINYIGHVHRELGQFDKANNKYQEVINIYKNAGAEAEIARVLGSLGLLNFKVRKFQKGIDNFLKAASIFKKHGNELRLAAAYTNIGHGYSYIKKYEKAKHYIDKASSIYLKNNLMMGFAANNIFIGDMLIIEGKYQEAKQKLSQALEFYKEQNIEPSISILISHIGLVFYLEKDYEEAISHFIEAINIIETIRRTAEGKSRRDYMAEQVSKYRILASAYIKNNELFKALQAIENSQAKFLMEKLKNTDSKISLVNIEGVQNDMKDSSAILTYSIPRIAPNARIKITKPIGIVVTKDSINGQELSAEEQLKSLLNQFDESVEFYNKNKRGIKITSHEGAQSDLLKPLLKKESRENLFRDLIDFYRTLIASPSQDNYLKIKKISQELYTILIKPIKKYIHGKENLIIIPDGIIGLIPFEMLIDEEGKYLVEKYDISYAPSIQTLKFLDNRNHGTREKPILAFGGAVYDEITYEADTIENNKQLEFMKKLTLSKIDDKRSTMNAYASLGEVNWSNLQGTLNEVKAISKIVSGTSVITGRNVNEHSIKNMSKTGELEQYKILHFATHGLTVPDFPELSAVVLSQVKKENEIQDGYLRISEIEKLNIKSDFVNLSACETGLGKIYAGEGVVGLIHSFLIAGANAVSASLWSVEDSSTAKFMVGVYQLVENRGITYAKAINIMKRAFIRGQVSVDSFDLSRRLDIGDNNFSKPNKLSNPFYWAPFVYYGNF